MGGSAASPTEGLRVKKDREAAVPPGDDLPQRKRPAHLPNIERHNQPIILFVTVCTSDRREILTSERVHSSLVRLWAQARQYHIGRYILMPEHLHLFCSPASREAENVKGWVAYWKRLASIELKELSPLWQRECWDTQLRDVGHYGDKWEYVVRNPVRKGLVSRSEDWPYQGCLNELRW
jgi:putative transposase